MARWRTPRRWPQVPLRLVAFSEADWGLDDGDPQRQWRAARQAWCVQHGFSYPGGPAHLPVGPLGDVIDQINAWSAVRRRPGEDGYTRYASG